MNAVPRFLPGLVTISFRQLDPAAIIALAVANKLTGLEWGGDVHVPAGDVRHAEQIGRQTREAGLSVAAYGSYYRAGLPEQDKGDWPAVRDAALALGAPLVRVWAGKGAPDGFTADGRREVYDDLRRITEDAQRHGLTVATEYHGGTLTETAASNTDLWQALNDTALKTLWQPVPTLSVEENVARMEAVAPRLANLHVFTWMPDYQRLPLADGLEDWSTWLDAVPRDGTPRYLLLEFVRDNDPANLPADATALHQLISTADS